MSQNVRRLFQQFQPIHYKLDLQPDRNKMVFNGQIVIDGEKVGRPSRRLTFHQNGLKIKKTSLTKLTGKTSQPVKVTRLNHHNSLNEVRLHTEELLYPGSYRIELAFSGRITRTMNGIYPCFYKHRGKNRQLIMTQFESHHAREVLPCIDEPEAKATFDLTLTTPAGETVLANTPIKSQKKTGSQQVTSFETTPRMSVYLLAFIYGDLHCLSGQSKTGVKVSTWATVAQALKQLEYAQAEAIGCLDYFEDYFQTGFPLPKLDLVAVPDFEAFGMENWGLITGRELGFLNDPANPSLSSQRLSTKLIAHEVSHMWFGDLVTMKWWDDLWLNESFATIMESMAPDYLHPDWQEWEDYTAGSVMRAANRDVYKDVQTVGVKVHHPDEIHSLFDPSIVYAKGGRLLKMLHDYIGDKAFREGLKSYFKKYAYQNTTRDDLWRELSASSGQAIDRLMTPWIEQAGTPELTIKHSGEELHLSQKRFLLDGEDDKSIWPIPLLSDQLKPLGVISHRSKSIKSANLPLFNPHGSGHYIVNYADEPARQKLVAKIVSRQLSSQGRIVALNDMLLEANKGTCHLSDILELVEACTSEDRDAVWSILLRTIGQAQVLTDGNQQTEVHIRAFKQDIASQWFDKLGWHDQPADDPNTKHLRTTMIALSVSGERPEAIKTALSTYAKTKSVEALPAELRSIIAGAAVRFGQPRVIKDLMDQYQSTNRPDVQSAIAGALCSTRDIEVARTIEKWGMHNTDVIKPQDIDVWFYYLMQNHYTRAVAWQWLVRTWPELNKLIGEKKMEFFVWYAARPISVVKWQKRFDEFFRPKLANRALRRQLHVAFSEIQTRIDWRSRDEALLVDYFKQFAN